MKKLLSCVLALMLLLSVASVGVSASAQSESVWNTYAKAGPHQSCTLVFRPSGSYYKYKVWFPKDIKKMGKCPVLLFCNPTSYNYETTPKYFEFLKYAVSRGYIVMMNSDKVPGNGESMNAGFNQLLKFNKNKHSVLYRKLDLNRVVAAGHSQGAVCAVNLADKTKFKNAKYIKAIFAASIMSPSTATSGPIKVPYNYGKVSVPILMIAGDGMLDDKMICPLDSGLQLLEKSWASDAYIARITGADHVDSMQRSFPYMLAWFDYQLGRSALAAKAFSGDAPELLRKSGWQDQSFKLARRSALRKVKAGKKSLRAVWNRDAGALGYELRYATNKKFRGAVTKKVSAASTAATVKGLKRKKVYYVSVRSYTTVNGKKYYSKWSAAKKVKVK